MFLSLVAVVTLTATASLANAGCPFAKSNIDPDPDPAKNGVLRASIGQLTKPVRRRRLDNKEDTGYSNQRVGDGGIPYRGYDAVRKDIKKLLTDSQPFWPADFGNYGGLFIRLAWHCNGTYRASDGRGGCDGGDILHDPVKSWPDNASLDKAIELLKPIKEKYGEKLSWGDLIVLSGDTAIESMGGTVLGFCGGRIDNSDGTESIPLGPSELQEELMPCGPLNTPGCESPLGSLQMGLIYVNPEGLEDKFGELIPSANSIRDVFGRMGFDDRSTVAAIGGGHAFGKSHGACKKDEASPEGCCPDRYDTCEYKFTSGLELKWTTIPTTWSNQYFNNLYDYTWYNFTGPGGAMQWKPVEEYAPDIGMFTSDLALTADKEYDKLSREYASDFDKLTEDFAKAWYQLMSRDVGPRSRCIGDELPAKLQDWESTLPVELSTDLPDYIPIRSKIQKSIDSEDNLSALVQLALKCSNTFRATDYRGGCNGARIRFSPESGWASNAGTSDALALLEPIKTEFPDISYADLIVLAGQTAIESAGGKAMAFCGGRADAEDGEESTGLEPVLYNNNHYATVVYEMSNKGLSMYEGVALFAAPKGRSTTLSNQYFKDLKHGNGEFNEYEKALLKEDLAPIVDKFIADNDLFLKEFALAWNYMMTSDLFDGPSANACQGVDIPTIDAKPRPTPKPPVYPAPKPTIRPPPKGCVNCDDTATYWMTVNGNKCGNNAWFKNWNNCHGSRWRQNKYCRKSCYFLEGVTYDGETCCSSSPPPPAPKPKPPKPTPRDDPHPACEYCSDHPSPWMSEQHPKKECKNSWQVNAGGKCSGRFKHEKFCQKSCFCEAKVSFGKNCCCY